MPKGDGLDVIRELKDKGRSERILVMSGGELASGTGAHAALSKPFDERQLMDGIERALQA